MARSGYTGAEPTALPAVGEGVHRLTADAANTPPTTRAARVITIVAVVLGVAYMGLLTFFSVPQLTD
ncbi:hypothetical protein [Streptomyces sp. NPDC023588]|uniref:hypothetical protein n=1 Tax=Streptomyces sp. NPDC023588 TaxID=3154907 RepID=UPI0033F4EE93